MPRLALTRRPGERIFITPPDGRVITVKVVEVNGKHVDLCIEAPADVRINREECEAQPAPTKV